MYDIYKALATGKVSPEKILNCYFEYMVFSVKKIPSQKVFLRNLELKMQDKEFLNDTAALLVPGEVYNPDEAFDIIKKTLIDKM